MIYEYNIVVVVTPVQGFLLLDGQGITRQIRFNYSVILGIKSSQ